MQLHANNTTHIPKEELRMQTTEWSMAHAALTDDIAVMQATHLPSLELFEQGLEERHGLRKLCGGHCARGGVFGFFRSSFQICLPFRCPPL